MSDLVIETHGLRKVFRTRQGVRTAVAGLDLAVPAGGVHGFLGPNGSGKTTTIRMLLGLARATAGEMRLFDIPVPQRLPAVIDRVGAVVEMPKFLPSLTGRQNLELLAMTRGISTERTNAALETVGLAGRAGDRYHAYSLGMKQRLAIAATLLKDPRLLILDEPTNGLDPAGIREIRDTIRELSQAGVTVLLSSHILAEVQQICDSVTIIGQGRMLASGPVSDMVDNGRRFRVVVPDLDRARQVLEAAGMAVQVTPKSLTDSPADSPADALTVEPTSGPDEITRILAAHDLWVSELTPQRADLETVFLRLTAGEALGEASIAPISPPPEDGSGRGGDAQ